MDAPALVNRAAGLIASLLFGRASRYTGLRVQLDDGSPRTNGRTVYLPRKFLGFDLLEEAWVGVALLAHEFGHWLQPLAEVQKAEKNTGLDHNTVNLLLDIQDDAMIEAAFPLFGAALKRLRKAAADQVNVNDLVQAALGDDPFARGYAALFCYRFGIDISGRFRWSSPDKWQAVQHAGAAFAELAPEQLPDELQGFAKAFPEFCRPSPASQSGSHDTAQQDGGDQSDSDPQGGQANGTGADESDSPAGEQPNECKPESEEGDAEGSSAAGSQSQAGEPPKSDDAPKSGQALGVAGSGAADECGKHDDGGNDALILEPTQLADELMQAVRVYGLPASTDVIKARLEGFIPPSRQVEAAAARIAPRWMNRQVGSMMAPGRFDRMAALRQEPVPFSQPTGKGKQKSPPRLVLAMDISASMNKPKWGKALTAGQVVQRAIESVSPEGFNGLEILFFTEDLHKPTNQGHKGLFSQWLDSLSMETLPYGGTSFAWLSGVWLEYPEHHVVVVTDGDGDYPPVVSDSCRKRTTVIAIDSGHETPWAAHRIDISSGADDLSALAAIIVVAAGRQR
jgi:hypothetical protein